MMDLVGVGVGWNGSFSFSGRKTNFIFPFPFPFDWNKYSCSVRVRDANANANAKHLKFIQRLTLDDEDADFDYEEFLDDDDGDYFEDEYATENAQVYAGDGAEGGGILLAGTWWDKEALNIAENIAKSFDGELGIYAFRTLANSRIQIRIEKLLTKSGSPSMSDIEAFSAAYRIRLDEAELAKTIPENIHLEIILE